MDRVLPKGADGSLSGHDPSLRSVGCQGLIVACFRPGGSPLVGDRRVLAVMLLTGENVDRVGVSPGACVLPASGGHTLAGLAGPPLPKSKSDNELDELLSGAPRQC